MALVMQHVLKKYIHRETSEVNVLIGALNLILGTSPHAPHYSVLRFALKKVKSSPLVHKQLLLFKH